MLVDNKETIIGQLKSKIEYNQKAMKFDHAMAVYSLPVVLVEAGASFKIGTEGLAWTAASLMLLGGVDLAYKVRENWVNRWTADLDRAKNNRVVQVINPFYRPTSHIL